METEKKLDNIVYKIYSLLRCTRNYNMPKDWGIRPCQKNFSCKILSGHYKVGHSVGCECKQLSPWQQWIGHLSLGFDFQRRKEFAPSTPRPIQLWDWSNPLSVEKVSYSRWNQKNRKVTTHFYFSLYKKLCNMASTKLLLVIMLIYREHILSQSSRYYIWRKCWLELVKFFSSLWNKNLHYIKSSEIWRSADW